MICDKCNENIIVGGEHNCKIEDDVSNSALSDVLFALREEYEWLAEENKEMEKNPDYYPEVDHYGLPYCKKVLERIAKKANVELVSK